MRRERVSLPGGIVRERSEYDYMGNDYCFISVVLHCASGPLMRCIGAVGWP